MKVSEFMTQDVRLASPDDPIQQAAMVMAEIDSGVLPVGENDRLVGMITDRDIAVRCIALGKGPETRVRDAMSADVQFCYEDNDVAEVMQTMADLQVRRLPVLSRQKRLVGIVSLGDLAMEAHPEPTGKALGAISQPGGPHSQATH